MQRPKVLIIVGPTASGKSALGVALARKFSARGRSALGGNGAEIISADSRQVYRGLDIGTGKITNREMRGVPHHLLDVASPKRKFSAANFINDAKVAIANISQKGKVPMIVGGTGYYIDALVGRILVPDVPPNIKLRAELSKKTAVELYALLGQMDPRRARAMATLSERNNKVRLIRALEIVAATGRVPAPTDTSQSDFDTLWIGINPPLKALENKIEKRLIARIKKGMIAEAVRLKKEGLSYKRMEELGLEYRSLARFLQKKITRQEMIEELKRDIRRYAKKQMMYWKRNTDIRWFPPTKKGLLEKTVRDWLKK